MITYRNIYYLSENTGILAKDMGKAILCQFPDTNFREETIPFIRTKEDAHQARIKILQQSNACRPVIISTLLDKNLNEVFSSPGIHLFTVLDDYICRTESILGEKALWESGFSRHDDANIAKRVNAIHYSINHDDGVSPRDYDEADLLLIGVSRSGKTPVSIYLATQMGIKTANYPLVGDDLLYGMLPEAIIRNRKKVIGLTITASILHTFREKRFPGSAYAQLETCQSELVQAKNIFDSYTFPVVFSDRHSIEETATQVYQHLDRITYPKTVS